MQVRRRCRGKLQPCDDSFLSTQTIAAPAVSGAWTRWKRQPMALLGVAVLACFVCAAIFAPYLAPNDPAAIDLTQRLGPPSAAHWFGTDELGRDILSRVIFGARISLFVSVSVVACSLALGLILGGLAGFYGGPLDVVLNIFVMNAFLSLPGILLAIAFVAFLGPGMKNLVLALSIGGWVGYARLVRAQVLAVKEREFVEAARALGASDLRIFTRHILPNILQPLIVQSAIGMAGVGARRSDAQFSRAWSSSTGGKLGEICSMTRVRTSSTRPIWCSFPRWRLCFACSRSTSSATRCATISTRVRDCRSGFEPMRVGVISDTHGLLRPEAVAALAGVDHILHAGDIGEATILDTLAAIAPLTAIRGNIDGAGVCAALPPTEILTLCGFTIYMLHSLDDLDLNPQAAGIDIVVSGHSHKPSIEVRKRVLYLNPGSAGPRRFSLPVSIAFLRLDGAEPVAEIQQLL